MIEVTNLLFVYVETPLHAGSGKGLGNVDLPIQRERANGYPIVQGSGLKGRLRADTDPKLNGLPAAQRLSEEEWKAIFGPDRNAPEHASAVSFSDARIILFPVRSLKGVFAWATSAHLLARFCRDAQLTGPNAPQWTIAPPLQRGQAVVAPNSPLTIQDGQAKYIVFEEFNFQAAENQLATDIAAWLKQYALPTAPEYTYWQNNLAGHLAILSDEDMRDFMQFSTEVVTRVAIDNDTKTVAPGALWTEESLPADTLLYAPVHASKPRTKKSAGMSSGADVLRKLRHLPLTRTRLGGDETVGRGSVYLRFWEG